MSSGRGHHQHTSINDHPQSRPQSIANCKVEISDFDKNSITRAFAGDIKQVLLRINDRLIGRLSYNVYGDYLLDKLQTAAAINALKGSDRVSFEVVDSSATSKTATLSGQGAYAAFLKMDEFQERIGTTAALVNKGLKDENGVIPPLEVPVVRRAIVPDARLFGSDAKRSKIEKKLVSSLESPNDCPLLKAQDKNIRTYPLNDNHVLVAVVCQGEERIYDASPSKDFRVGYWVMDKQVLGVPSPVTFNATNYGNGLISAQLSEAVTNAIAVSMHLGFGMEINSYAAIVISRGYVTGEFLFSGSGNYQQSLSMKLFRIGTDHVPLSERAM